MKEQPKENVIKSTVTWLPSDFWLPSDSLFANLFAPHFTYQELMKLRLVNKHFKAAIDKHLKLAYSILDRESLSITEQQSLTLATSPQRLNLDLSYRGQKKHDEENPYMFNRHWRDVNGYTFFHRAFAQSEVQTLLSHRTPTYLSLPLLCKSEINGMLSPRDTLYMREAKGELTRAQSLQIIAKYKHERNTILRYYNLHEICVLGQYNRLTDTVFMDLDTKVDQDSRVPVDRKAEYKSYYKRLAFAMALSNQRKKSQHTQIIDYFIDKRKIQLKDALVLACRAGDIRTVMKILYINKDAKQKVQCWLSEKRLSYQGYSYGARWLRATPLSAAALSGNQDLFWFLFAIGFRSSNAIDFERYVPDYNPKLAKLYQTATSDKQFRVANLGKAIKTTISLLLKGWILFMVVAIVISESFAFMTFTIFMLSFVPILAIPCLMGALGVLIIAALNKYEHNQQVEMLNKCIKSALEHASQYIPRTNPVLEGVKPTLELDMPIEPMSIAEAFKSVFVAPKRHLHTQLPEIIAAPADEGPSLIS